MNDFGARPVFFVQDTPRAMEFYVNALGFNVDWTYEENGRPYVVQVSLFGIQIILNQKESPADERAGHGRIFIGLDDDQSATLLQHVRNKGISAEYAQWGAPTMAIYDLDRNELYFWLSDTERVKWQEAQACDSRQDCTVGSKLDYKGGQAAATARKIPTGGTMKYVIWFVRFWYAAWMIPAGLEHFYHIYPQPGANSTHPLAAEMLTALLHTHLFDLVKAVELITGIAVLFGFFTPLALLACMPVAFCVFWWDAPLSEWNRGSVIAGARIIASNVLLCFAYIASFRSMFVVRAPTMNQLTLAARVIFGAWMLLNGANHFLFSFWSTPTGQEPLSTELMTALVDSRLLDVCMLIELVAGALILLGYFVPAALCVVMAVSTCALFWAILDHQPQTLALGFVAFALNGLLMLAYLPYYRDALQRAPLTLGESDRRTSWNSMFVQANGRTSRGHFQIALLPLVLAVLWYASKGPAVDVAPWGVLVLLYPAVILQVRRLHDMGRTGWLTLIPAVLTVAAMLIWAHRVSLGAQLDAAVPLAALVIFVGFALWGCIARGQAETNTFGPPVAA